MTDARNTDSTLLLLHPIGLSGECFQFLGLDNAIGVDLLGHGGRPRVPQMTLEDLADDVVSRYDGPLDLVGLSLGAMTSMYIAIRHPERVRSLLFACSGLEVDREMVLARAIRSEVGMDNVLQEMLGRWFSPAVRETPDHPGVAFATRSLLAMDPNTFADGWRAIAGWDVIDRLGELSIPVTCVGGTLDIAAPPDQVRALADRIDGARFVLLDAPHMAHLEVPEEFAAAIRNHLTGVDS